MRHDGRTALITGAASGIGRVTAFRLARDGARLALFDREPTVVQVAEGIAATGARARAWVVDVADAAAVEAAVGEASAACGAIDILVNGAGIVDHVAPLARMDPDAWMREIAVNLGGPFNLIRVIAPGMAERGWGRIVNISSMAARGGLFLQTGYAASKSGLLGLTRNVTLEFARRGVTCNAVLPGLIATEKVLAMPESIRVAGIGAAPARRLGEPDEVAALISFLGSDDAGFINGAEIDISGGAHLNTLALGSRRENTAGRTPSA
jgi:NAD(P)-dependent dehydrogenase (short-subunit alcohol dehydrogenase family)